ncbi:ribose-5-phosphate isomerase RpiA [Dictyobacter aurantiacus]|uniref:Ribose-5-phosphate isomerase A n=1 Tax=Dictyobacter aurantiacus TaxID=1936993 RepID=A0A401ZH97_9CHLR|nr:ribose-5-phosphate isomerase RpiA [Dictyobacter aurantiacus]GCE06260.1 ribose-5-phosphate isomerase A [Dictyobacter aurantiacus]
MTAPMSPQDTWKQRAGSAAADLIEEGMVVGLGTGSTAAYLVRALAQRIQQGLQIKGAVASSLATYEMANNLNIPMTDLDDYPELDIYIDGADEIDPQLRLIKGAGGALLREKILASAARRFVVIADSSKKVTQLGHRYPLPVEIIPLAKTPIALQISRLGAQIQIRHNNNIPFITDNHNYILDCTFPQGIGDPAQLDAQLHNIVGVVETGLFIHMVSQVIIGGPEGVQVFPQ